MFLNNQTDIVKNVNEHLLENILISKLYLPYKCKNLIAFTLAEVLITLLIIGIVSSIVIPALIQETQEAECRVAFKKGMATFSQAFMRMRMDNGGTLTNVFHSGDHTGFKQVLSQYLNIVAYSSTSTTVHNETWHDYATYKELNGTTETGRTTCSGCPSAELPDGSFFEIILTWSANDLTTCNLGGSAPRDGLCFNIVYDVNGRNKPNIIGKDIYILAVYKDKIVPADWMRSYGSIDEASCTTSSTGYGCAIKYAKE